MLVTLILLCKLTNGVTQKVKNFIYLRVSILQWLPKYTKGCFIGDLIAGLTIGLTLMPQSLAYAALADLTPQYGLYSAFMGTFVYVIFGTIKEVSIGPTSLMALLSVSYTRDLPVDFIILLGFLAGWVELIMGILKLGFLVDFISVPTISGFQSATSVIIIGTQLKGLFGLKFKGKGFLDNIRKLFTHLPETKYGDAIIGVSCIVVLLLFRKLKDINIKTGNPSRDAIIKKSLWMLSISRNAITVLVCSIIAYQYDIVGMRPFTLSGTVDPGLPPFALPKFESKIGNETIPFLKMVEKLGTGILMCPLVAVLANVAIAKAFSAGKAVDATQEMLTLGLCNILGSFVKSMPTCGAFTRSAVSNASGVRTPLAGVYSGVLILLALTFLTPYFFFIPRATLSAVLIAAVFFMIDFEILRPLWKSNKFDFLTTVSTFTISLCFGVEIGLLYGVVINAGNLLWLWARPKIEWETIKLPCGQDYILVSPSIGMFYPSIDYFRNKVNKIGIRHGNLPVVLDCKSLFATDYTATKGIESLCRDFETRNQQLILYNITSNVSLALSRTVDEKKICLCGTNTEVQNVLCDQKLNGDLLFNPLVSERDAEKDIGSHRDLRHDSIVSTSNRLHARLMGTELKNLDNYLEMDDEERNLRITDKEEKINIGEDGELLSKENHLNSNNVFK